MNPAQKAAIETNLAKLCDEIDVDEIILILRLNRTLSKRIVQRIQKESNDESRALFLTDYLKTRDDGWTALLDALRQAHQSHLADLLNRCLELESERETAAKEPQPNRPPEPTSTIFDLKQLQSNLRENIKEDCEIIRQAWHNNLPVTDLTLTYQEIKLTETNGGRTFERNIKCEDYSYLRHPTIRIFLIEGDPGIGKSTYVNKLAMDWANQHPMLNETFDFVLVVSWIKLDERYWKKSIISAFGNEMNEDSLRDLLKSKKSLIILDGYDENPMKQVLQEITSKYDPTTKDRMSMAVLITTRGSHVEDFKKFYNKIWLRILGFDEKSATSFIKVGLLESTIFLKQLN